MPKQSKSNSIFYIKLASLNDLCRYAENFDYTASNMISIKNKEGYTLTVFGEQLEGSILSYYIKTTDSEDMISYTYPASSSQSENAHFVKEMGPHPNHYINILQMEGSSIKVAKKLKPIPTVKIQSAENLIIAVIRKGIANESVPYIYSFNKAGKTFFCAFDLIEELSDGPHVLYYAISNRKPDGIFARYKYTENKVDFAEYMGEHSYMYAKVINLAESFPFPMPE